MHWKLSKLLLVVFLFFSLGCELFPQKDSQPKTGFKPVSSFVNAEYEKTWRAAQIALSRYPIQINNIDSGILETLAIGRYDLWTPYHAKKSQQQGGQFYKLKIRMIKGRVRGRPAVKISIKKTISRRRDFFANSEKIPSDHLEEEALLYRIKRELIMEKKLERLAEEKL